MTRALITGISGMAGSHLAEYLLTMPDMEVFGTIRWRSNLENITPETRAKVKLIECDLRDQTSTDHMIRNVQPDMIFHLAAQSYVPVSWNYPHETFTTNVLSQCNLFEAIRAHRLDPRVIVAGSSEEYGMVLPEETPIKEDNPLRPLSPYGVSKVAQDLMAYQYHKSYGLKVVRARAFNHEGPRRGKVFVTSNFAYQVAKIEEGRFPPVIRVGNLDSVRDFTDVRDTVRAYYLAITQGIPGDVYNICSGIPTVIKDVVQFYIDRAKVPITVEQDPDRMRPSDVTLLLGDGRKFHEQTGWIPSISLERTLQDTLDYWRDQIKKGRIP